jgi:hypothetical protein
VPRPLLLLLHRRRLRLASEQLHRSNPLPLLPLPTVVAAVVVAASLISVVTSH